MLHGRGRHRSDLIAAQESCIGAASLFPFEKGPNIIGWTGEREGAGWEGGREG